MEGMTLLTRTPSPFTIHVSPGVHETVLITGGCGYRQPVVRQLSGRLVSWCTTTSPPVSAMPDSRRNPGARDLADTERLAALFVSIVSDRPPLCHCHRGPGRYQPLKYYGNNTRNTLNLLQACIAAGVGSSYFPTPDGHGCRMVGGGGDSQLSHQSQDLQLMSRWMLRIRQLPSCGMWRSVTSTWPGPIPGAHEQRTLGEPHPESPARRRAGGCRGGFSLRHRLRDARQHRHSRLPPYRGPGGGLIRPWLTWRKVAAPR
jgi:UDP-glucose 4-epimerase